MSIEDDIKTKEAELAALVKQQELELKRKAEELAKAKADLEKAKLDTWTPTQENVRKLINEEREYKGYGGRIYKEQVGYALYNDETDEIEINASYTIEHLYTEGGGEGDGEEHWLVFVIKKHGEIDSYWYVPGYYQSYDGGNLEWNNIYECEPVQVMVTQYQRKK